jgi:Flp pilus assembly protein TadG
MTSNIDAEKRSGFLGRLRRDQAGNTFAIFAAAIFPIAGLVGGAVDMSRIYAVKSRLQAACDAGSLAGRKVMGNGRWDVNNNSNLTDDATHTSALQMFDLNYANGYIGSENRTRTFTESNGTVTGTATADVPMTLMKIFGEEQQTIEVTCTSQMKIPHSDVMFVFDVTGSMANKIPGDPTNTTKINGLKVATKCFYEALARQDIDDVTATQCGKATDPIGDLSTLTQLRFGFVPFDEQVNVGALLPNGYFADTQSIQSRRPTSLQTVQTWTASSAGSIVGWLNDWSPASPAANPYNTIQSPSSGWTDITSGNTTTLQGSKPFQQSGATTAAACNAFNTLPPTGTNTLTGLTQATGTAATPNSLGTTNATPVYPAASQVTSYNQTRTATVTQYRYILEKRGSITSCFLEKRNHGTTYTQTQTGGTSTKTLTWTQRQQIVGGWTYANVNFNVSALKAGGGNNASLSYNTSLQMPLNESSLTVNLSGSATSSSIKIPANTGIAWTGCIEEAQTFQNTDGDPSDDWNPIPDEAYDMHIDNVPNSSDPATQWKFQLPNAQWARHNNVAVDVTGDGQNDYYEPEMANIVRPDTGTSGWSRNTSAGCPKAAAKLAVYRDLAGATSFKAYVNALSPGGNTYHDIGLLWGARLMSPTGLFAAENATTPNGQEIQRHMIFMTDGETFNVGNNYTPYGLDAWDRRRTPSGVHPTLTTLNNATDARTVALCTAIKNLGNNGVTLWVVYYGTTDLATTERMKNCATSRNNHFFAATNTTSLITTFNQIADSISELKLTG